MSASKLVFKALNPRCIWPRRATDGAAGYDLFLMENRTYAPGVNRHTLGLSVRPPKGFYGKIVERSSAGTIGLGILGGVIDDDFDINTEIVLIVHNRLKFEIKAERGKSIAQLIINRKYTPTILCIGYKGNTSIEGSEHVGVGSTGNAIKVPELENVEFTQPRDFLDVETIDDEKIEKIEKIEKVAKTDKKKKSGKSRTYSRTGRPRKSPKKFSPY